jgi:exosome complex component RRP46
MPALMQTAVLALLSAGVPMRATATATAVAVVHQDGAKKTIVDPSPREIETAQSVHALAFTSHGGLLLAESEGDFTVKEWDDLYETAKGICCRAAPAAKEGMAMVLDDEESSGTDMRQFLRSTMESKVAADLHWK